MTICTQQYFRDALLTEGMFSNCRLALVSVPTEHHRRLLLGIQHFLGGLDNVPGDTHLLQVSTLNLAVMFFKLPDRF